MPPIYVKWGWNYDIIIGMSQPESYTTLTLGGLPRDFEVATIDRNSDNPLLAVLGDIANYFGGNPEVDWEVTDEKTGRVLNITLGNVSNGNKNTTLVEYLDKLCDLGVSYDVKDDGSYEFNASVDWWRPGMAEVESSPCNLDRDLMLYRQVVETVLADFPDALAALQAACPAPPDLGDAPVYHAVPSLPE